ncbi:MAG: ABC transporter substrate-binding protein [Firmicutes bacterium]|nr:ABC transporter substrate-binding protein [Bacillota bacterium]
MSKKKYVWLVCMFLIMIALLVAGCSGNNKETTPNNENEKDLNLPGNNGSNNEEITADEPVYGGTLRVIVASGPTAIGHPTEGGVARIAAGFPGVESLLGLMDDNQGLEPLLAESWLEDPDNMTITFKLREGVKFHDGSELTAEVVKWNFEFFKSKSRLRYVDYLDEIEVKDKYTVVFHLNNWVNLILGEWSVMGLYSQKAIEENGEDWAYTHLVGTGPFKLEKFTRDVGANWIKNEDYWQEGQPYLDRVEYYYIPEQSTASMMMEAGEADIWTAADALNTSRLAEKGFVVQKSWAGQETVIIPNTLDPNSPFQDKRLREAVEYALDKQALAAALGYGLFEPIDTIVSRGMPGGDKQFRSYDPEKARQLLQEAGYTDGLPISIIAQVGSGGRNEIAEAVAGYLNEVGFKVELDIADAGRFLEEVWNGNWKDLAVAVTATTNLASMHIWWGPQGIFVGGLRRPDEFVDMFRASLQLRTKAEQDQAMAEMVHFIAEEALVIPVYHEPVRLIHNGKVHTDYLRQGQGRWKFNEVWIEK